MEAEFLMAITSRILPPEEWDKLAEREPFASGGGLPDPQHALILVVEEDDQILAHTLLIEAVHWHFYIEPEHQKRAPVFGRLLTGGMALLQERRVEAAHTTIHDLLPEVQAMAERFGFVKAPGSLYILRIPPKE